MIKRAKRRAVGSGTWMSGDSVSNSAAKISGGSVMSTPRPCSAAVYALRPLCSALHELVLDRWPHRCKSIIAGVLGTRFSAIGAWGGGLPDRTDPMALARLTFELAQQAQFDPKSRSARFRH
jgi:hypothetical protein